MSRYEYKVVPAPKKGVKGKGVKGPEARFSHAIEILMNDMAAEGWEYQRAETLPSTERSGLTSTTTEWRNVLIFRRAKDTEAVDFAPELLPPPEPVLTAPLVAAAAVSGAPEKVAEQNAEKTADKADNRDAEPVTEETADAASEADEAAENTTQTEDDQTPDKSDASKEDKTEKAVT